MYCRLSSKPNTQPIEFGSKIQAEINQNWELFTARRPTEEIATLCRLLKVESDKLLIATDVSYKDVVGLRWKNLVSHDRALFQVVTAIAMVKTSDGHMVLIPRDSGDWEPSLECSGGFVRRAYLQDDNILMTDFIKQRVCDDLQIKLEQVKSLDYLTTYNAKEILEYMLIYEVTLTQTKQELAAKYPYFVIMPPEYTPENHHNYTNLPLHVPSAGAMREIASIPYQPLKR